MRKPWEGNMTAYNPVRALEPGLIILEAVNKKDRMRIQKVAHIAAGRRPRAFACWKHWKRLAWSCSQSQTARGTRRYVATCSLQGFWQGLDRAIAMPEMTTLRALWTGFAVGGHMRLNRKTLAPANAAMAQ
jgi:hypothetical protein